MSEHRHGAPLGLGLLRRKRMEQLEPWGLGWGAEGEDGQGQGLVNASSSSSSTDPHHCSGHPTAEKMKSF